MVAVKYFSRLVCVSLGAVLLAACGDAENPPSQTAADDDVKLGPFGPPLGARARVVRSVQVETNGAISSTFTGSKSDEDTGLMGLCNPSTFANFMLTMPGGDEYDEVWVTNYSEGEIGTGETGEFDLRYIEVTLRKTTVNDFIQREFRGPGTMTLTTHEADPDNRRIVGIMEGTDLQGKSEDQGKALSVKVSFDMDSSCGVHQ